MVDVKRVAARSIGARANWAEYEEGRRWTVYIIENTAGILYTGIAKDVQRRLRMHNGEISGGAKYTSRRRPWRVVFSDDGYTHGEALRIERQIKKLSKARKLVLVQTHGELEEVLRDIGQ